MTISDQTIVLRKALEEQLKQAAKALRRQSPGRNLFGRPSPERLILAPQDLRPGDPLVAIDMYSSRFFFAGRMIDCTGRDPFTLTSAPANWQKELHSFQWLRHFESSDRKLSISNAQALLTDWLSSHSRPSNILAWDEEVTARRLISWLCHSVPLVQSAKPVFYRNWLKSIGKHIHFLKYRATDSEDGIPRLVVRIALVYAGLCVSGQTSGLRRWMASLDRELARQFFEDGGHISRNSLVIPDILVLLLPLRESFGKLGMAPSQTLVSSIDRMMAALKFFQLGDGNLARFNGVSSGRPDLVSTVLFYDDAPGTAPKSASQSGYQRLAMGDTIVLCDTGNPPPDPVSHCSQAGTLSFELSCGSNLVMVNCGAPISQDGELSTLSRATAAHNTLTIADTSSSKYYTGRHFRKLLSRKLLLGPRNTRSERYDGADAIVLEASHDGYAHRFGLLHSRSLKLSDNGRLLEGIDRLAPTGKRKRLPVDFAIRLHLHPSVSVGKSGNGTGLVLMCGSGLVWKFTCPSIIPDVEESIFLASSSGPKRTKQIILKGNTASISEVAWSLERQLNLHDLDDQS
jgi:uncharacterized heparinase superfamily protein